ncbi:MAG: hypothetical protein ACI4II_02835 [Acutalibacteraceae bacterium]
MYYENDISWCRPYLSVDESVLWYGKPVKGKLLTKEDIVMIPFSIMWCSFAIFWAVGVLTIDSPLFFKIWGILFSLIGLYIAIGRFFYKSYILKRTSYVITNQRLIRLRNKRVDMLSGSEKSDMIITMNKDGSGTISFRNTSFFLRRHFFLNAEFELTNIDDVNRVQQILLRMDK